ncbi:acyltransferase [Antrihabitans stalactiti]|nr:acyltransferase [Antrihabitans stalactiti]
MKTLPLLRLVDRFSQRRYMRLATAALRSGGMEIDGQPLWVAPSIYVDSKEQGIISLGHRCVLSEHVMLLTHDFSLDRYSEKMGIAPSDMEYETKGKIRIGDYAFIGIRSIIMPGVTIGDGAIVGAGSVVTKSVGDGMVVAGNPARELGTVESAWERNQAQWQLKRRRP